MFKSAIILISAGLIFWSSNGYSQSTVLDASKIKIYYASLETGEANPLKEYEVEVINEKLKWGYNMVVYPNITFQTLEGLGGAFNEIGGEALSYLEPGQKEQLLNNLFGKENAGFTFCRTAIGSSDFGIDAYSYSEEPEDYKLKHFSIERDKQYVLPYIKGALKYNPDLVLFGSPWSPPGWMKKSGKMTGMDPVNGSLRNETEIYNTYANYFVKYIKGYKENGVIIDRICIQNETDASTVYPSNVMPPEQLLDFGINYMKPAFEKNKLTTGIYAGTFRAAEKLDMHTFMGLEGADKLDGIGIQYMAGNLIQEAQIKYPGFKMFHTESDCYNGENSTEQAKNRFAEISRYINAGLTTFTYWNMILNETTKSGWDWSQNSLVNINRQKKSITYNPDYNAMYIMSKFLKPGDVRIAALHRKGIIGLKDANGTIKILIQNEDMNDQGYLLGIDYKETKIKIPRNAIVAIVIKK